MIAKRVATLRERVCSEFLIEPRELRVGFSQSLEKGAARTLLSKGSEKVATILLSDTDVSDGILAHEITHVLIPTRWLFFAEGFATLASILVMGDCRDSFFGYRQADDVLRENARSLTPLRRLASENVSSFHMFDPAKFASRESRLAFVQGASFLRWLMWERAAGKMPELARSVAANTIENPAAALEERAGLGLDRLEREWRREIGIPMTEAVDVFPC